MNISDQRSYIKIGTLRDKNPTEINGALSEVCGEFTVDPSGCVSIDNDPRPERPRISTEERSVKLVAEAHEEDLPRPPQKYTK